MSLDARVVAAAPGGGTPTGTVVFLTGRRKLGSAVLAGGEAAVKVRPGLIHQGGVQAQYRGDARFLPSVSPRVKITGKVTAAMARPSFRQGHR